MISNISVRGTLRAMEPNQVVEIPFGMRSYSYIYSCASMLGMEMNRKYSVHVDRQGGHYKITREA